MDLGQGQLGPEVSYEVKVEAGVAIISAKYQGMQAGAEASVHIDAGLLLDELAKKIPGSFDDAVLAIVKSALKAL